METAKRPEEIEKPVDQDREASITVRVSKGEEASSISSKERRIVRMMHPAQLPRVIATTKKIAIPPSRVLGNNDRSGAANMGDILSNRQGCLSSKDDGNILSPSNNGTQGSKGFGMNGLIS